MELGVHQPRHGVRYVVRRERRAVGEKHPSPKLERDAASLLVYLPGLRQFGNQLLRFAVHANQNPAGDVADRFGIVVLHLQRVERFRIGAQAESQFPAGLRQGRGGESRNK